MSAYMIKADAGRYEYEDRRTEFTSQILTI